MIRARTTKWFDRQFARAPLWIQKQAKEILGDFIDGVDPTLLGDHELHGAYSHYRSIAIDDDHRAVYRKNGKEILFIAFGTHEELYGKGQERF